MKEKQQNRDSKGRFASKAAVAATAKSKAKKPNGKAKDSINWKGAYDEKVVQFTDACNRIEQLNDELQKSYEHNKELASELAQAKEYGNNLNTLAGKYLESVEKYEIYCIELRKQIEWLRDKLAWYTKLRFFKVLSKMAEAYTHHRHVVAESMRAWH